MRIFESTYLKRNITEYLKAMKKEPTTLTQKYNFIYLTTHQHIEESIVGYFLIFRFLLFHQFLFY